MLRAAGLRTQILAYDHNWTEHPGDVAATPPDETADIDAYPQNVLSSAGRKWVSGVAYHCYSGDPSAMSAFHAQFPDKAIYFTECSGSQSSVPANTFSDTLKWHARNLIIGATRNWAETVVNWNIALDPANGPHVGGCGTCTGVVTVGPGDTVTDNAEYYTLGHLARFVKPGAVRIASTSFGTTGWNGQVMDVAFRNPDGGTVLVAHNENDNPQTFAVQEGGQSLHLHVARRRAGHLRLGRPRRRRRRAAAGRAGRLDRDRRPRRPDATRAAPPTSRRTPSTATPAPATPRAPGRRPASTCRSTSASRSRPAGSCSTPAPRPATTRAGTPWRPARTAPPGPPRSPPGPAPASSPRPTSAARRCAMSG